MNWDLILPVLGTGWILALTAVVYGFRYLCIDYECPDAAPLPLADQMDDDLDWSLVWSPADSASLAAYLATQEGQS